MFARLRPGEVLVIGFAGEAADRPERFEVHFDSPEHPRAIVIKETAAVAGTSASQAVAILHHSAIPERPLPPGVEKRYDGRGDELRP
jgi:hypothetical protein